MEYTYRNSLKEKEATIQLQTYDMVLTSDSTKHVIPYPDVLEIRLNKSKRLFSVKLSTLNFGTIQVTSQSFGSTGTQIDQSRAYATFTRVLHMHLLEKSKAHYFTGSTLSKLTSLAGMWAITFLIFFVLNGYFDFVPGNPLLIALLIFSGGTLLLLGLQLKQWPKPYNPTNIPLHMLPSAN